MQLFQYVRYAGDEDCFCADAVIEIVGYAFSEDNESRIASYFFGAYANFFSTKRLLVVRGRRT